MGLFDIFKRKKVPQLPEGTQPVRVETPREDKLSQYNVSSPIVHPGQFDEKDYIFSEDSKSAVFTDTSKETGKPILVIRRQAISGNMLDLGTVNGSLNREDLKRMLTSLDSILDTPRVKGGLNPQRIATLKKTAKTQLDDLAKSKGIEFSPEMQKVLDTINVQSQLVVYPDSILDYRGYEEQLQKTVDISELPFDQVMEYGEAFSSRLRVLKSIQTLDDAYLHKASLINFMRSKEPSSLQGKLLAMIPPQDSNASETPESKATTDTLMKVLETVNAEEVPNEDHLLYSAFLKLEEKRILSKFQDDLRAFQISIGTEVSGQIDELDQANLSAEEAQAKKDLILRRRIDDYKQAGTLVGMIEEEKLNLDNTSRKETAEPVQAEITSYIISMLTQVNASNYLKNGFRRDLSLKGFLAQHKDEIPNAEAASTYLASKMHSSGQVTDIPRPDSLRSFIETTDYMSPDVGQEKEFLLCISRLEENYILRFYAPILKMYNMQMDKQNASRNR